MGASKVLVPTWWYGNGTSPRFDSKINCKTSSEPIRMSRSKRYGCSGSLLVNVIDVDKLLRKKIPSPWVPKIKDALDASHFDSYRHVENEPPSNKPNITEQQQQLFEEF